MDQKSANILVLTIAEKVREVATRQGNVPFLTGDLRKSITVRLKRPSVASISSVLPYARAVHDGRKAITIRPNLRKNPRSNPKRARLRFKVGGKIVFARQVFQPARKGKPFIKEAFKQVTKDYSFLKPTLNKIAKEEVDKIRKALRI